MLFDHVVVYSAHFTRYGSLPATLHRYLGGVTFVAITWLDEGQLARMHETEALGVNYDYVEVADIRLEHDGDVVASPLPVGAYVSRHGPLRHAAMPVRLAETASSGCPYPALTQPAALRFANRRVAPELSFEDFARRIVEDEGFRRACSGGWRSSDGPGLIQKDEPGSSRKRSSSGVLSRPSTALRCGEAAEPGDDVAMAYGVVEIAGIAQGPEQRHRALLVGQVLGMLEREVEKTFSAVRSPHRHPGRSRAAPAPGPWGRSRTPRRCSDGCCAAPGREG